MDHKLKELKKVFGQNRIRVNEPMSAHTTFKIGGPGQFYMEVANIDDLVKAVKVAHGLKISVFVFGGGSNIIVSDSGIKGLVIKNNCRKFRLANMTGKVKNREVGVEKAMVFAESGVVMNQLVRFTIDQGLGGLEYQLGLPGTVGGAIFMNSNFPQKGVFVGDCAYQVTIVTKEGKIRELDKSYFKFAYDKSILQETGEIVLSVIFKLTPLDKKILWDRGMEALNYRNETQPKGSSAGCTFRNISLVEAMNIPTPNQITSAGYLIDRAGLKGKRVGDAMVSPLHANFILNMDKAKADDVVKLVNFMKEQVYNKFGVHLSLEVKTVGF